jgi:hypothetical protein
MNHGVIHTPCLPVFKEQSNYYKTSYREILPNIHQVIRKITLNNTVHTKFLQPVTGIALFIYLFFFTYMDAGVQLHVL